MAKDLFDSLYSKSGELIHSFTKHATEEAVAKPGDLPKPDAKKSAAASRAEKGKGSGKKPSTQKNELPNAKGTKVASDAEKIPDTAQLTQYRESLKKRYEEAIQEKGSVAEVLKTLAESLAMTPKALATLLEGLGIMVKEDEEETDIASEKEAEVFPEKEYFGEQGDDKQFYMVRVTDEAGNVTGLEIVDELGEKVTDSLALGIEDVNAVGDFVIAASAEIEADMISYDLFMNYVYPMIDKDEEVEIAAEEDEIEDVDLDMEEEEPLESKKQRTTKKIIKCTKGDKVTEYRLKKVEVVKIKEAEGIQDQSFEVQLQEDDGPGNKVGLWVNDSGNLFVRLEDKVQGQELFKKLLESATAILTEVGATNEGKIPKDVNNKSDKAEKELREEDAAIQKLLKKHGLDEGTIVEGRTVELNSLQAHVANSLLKWAVEQPKVKSQSTKKGSLVNWVSLTKPLIQRLDQEEENGIASIRLDAMEAGVIQALVGWALEQPKIKKELDKPEAIVNIEGVGKSILDMVTPTGEEVETGAEEIAAPESMQAESPFKEEE